MSTSLDALEAGSFQEHLDSAFELRDGEVSASLTLTEVAILRESPVSGRRAFSLVFEGPAVPAVPQGTYALHHEALGELELFLVPIGSDERGVRYEVIFT